KSLLVRGDAEQLSDLPVPKDLPLAFASRYTRREQATSHLVTVLCLPAKSGILLATSDVSPADRTPLADELTSLLLRMLAAQRPSPRQPGPNLPRVAGRGSVDPMITDERLTWKQICERYPEQFVLLIDHERLPHDRAGFKTARVLSVGTSRAE